MSREDQKLTELDEIVRKPKREMVWKRSKDGVLRRVFKKEIGRTESNNEENNTEVDLESKENDSGSDGNDFCKKASDLLKVGVMPLVPPGRRDWKGDNEFHIHLNGCDFTWPPQQWQQMTHDRRLMAWKHTAFQLEYLQNGVLSPTMSRSFLLDKYNFLALPGSGKVKREENEKGAARARFYLYQMLSEIANRKNPSEAEKSQIITLELVKNTGELQKQLSLLEKPLRLVV
jgi:hypothetical protein